MEHWRESLRSFKKGDKEEQLPVDGTHGEKGQELKTLLGRRQLKVSSTPFIIGNLDCNLLSSSNILRFKSKRVNGRETKLLHLKAPFGFLTQVSKSRGRVNT